MLTPIHIFDTKTQYIHEETGYDCLIIKNTEGTHDIFVGLPTNHHYWNKSHTLIPIEGLDYSSFCQHTDEKTGICHIGIPGKKTKVWWVGVFANYHDNIVDSQIELEKLAFKLKKLEVP